MPVYGNHRKTRCGLMGTEPSRPTTAPRRRIRSRREFENEDPRPADALLIAVVIGVLVAVLVFAIAGNADAMEACQALHSHDTCFHALTR